MNKNIIALVQQSITVKQALCADEKIISTIEAVITQCISTLKNGGKILLAGNGGSAADAQHIAAELVGRFEKDRPGLAAIALNTNASNLTAIANDYDYSAIFARQIEALGRQGDLFFGFSTSGNSPNIVSAVEKAQSMNISTIGMTGDSGGKLKELTDYCICVPATNTARIQESHIMIGHILCGMIEENITK